MSDVKICDIKLGDPVGVRHNHRRRLQTHSCRRSQGCCWNLHRHNSGRPFLTDPLPAACKIWQWRQSGQFRLYLAAQSSKGKAHTPDPAVIVLMKVSCGYLNPEAQPKM